MPSARVFAVLVLYGREARQSEAFASLEAAAAALPAIRDELQLLVYDNSPQAHAVPQTGLRLRYTHDPANGGLAPAYNAALPLAEEAGAEWLLLLDQDTEFPPAFPEELLAFMGSDAAQAVVAAVPRLMDGEVVLSPRSMPRLSHRRLPEGAYGVARERVSAFNSGALLRVDAVRAAGGFPAEYTLDFLDHAVFHALQRAGGRVWLLRSRLKHQLSTRAPGASMSTERYARMLRNEARFHAQEADAADRAWYKLRQARRVVGLLVRGTPWRFVRLELRALLGQPL